jgi:hypothetical protein
MTLGNLSDGLGFSQSPHGKHMTRQHAPGIEHPWHCVTKGRTVTQCDRLKMIAERLEL